VGVRIRISLVAKTSLVWRKRTRKKRGLCPEQRTSLKLVPKRDLILA
jgi:hypothetical protein